MFEEHHAQIGAAAANPERQGRAQELHEKLPDQLRLDVRPPVQHYVRVGFFRKLLSVVLILLCFAPLVAVGYLAVTKGFSGSWGGEVMVAPKVAVQGSGSDRDLDGLTGAEEEARATDPQGWDTDRDGYGDGEEVGSGFDPLKAAPTAARAQWQVIRPQVDQSEGFSYTVAKPKEWTYVLAASGDGIVLSDASKQPRLSIYVKKKKDNDPATRIGQAFVARFVNQRWADAAITATPIILNAHEGYLATWDAQQVALYEFVIGDKQVDVFAEGPARADKETIRALQSLVLP